MSNIADTEQPTHTLDCYENHRKTITISRKNWMRLKQNMSYDSTFDSAISELLDKVEGRRFGTPEGT